jgi:hypothetical protein
MKLQQTLGFLLLLVVASVVYADFPKDTPLCVSVEDKFISVYFDSDGTVYESLTSPEETNYVVESYDLDEKGDSKSVVKFTLKCTNSSQMKDLYKKHDGLVTINYEYTDGSLCDTDYPQLPCYQACYDHYEVTHCPVNNQHTFVWGGVAILIIMVLCIVCYCMYSAQRARLRLLVKEPQVTRAAYHILNNDIVPTQGIKKTGSTRTPDAQEYLAGFVGTEDALKVIEKLGASSMEDLKLVDKEIAEEAVSDLKLIPKKKALQALLDVCSVNDA